MLVQTCSQMHVQVKQPLAHLQDLIPTLAGIMTSGSESWSRKVILMRAFKKRDNYHEYFTHNNRACFCFY